MAHFVPTVPSLHFPLDGVLSAQRRIDLIEYLQQHDPWLLEDDCDCEFRYTGVPVQPLRTLAPERVLYFGSLGKVFYPLSRLAFAAIGKNLREAPETTSTRGNG